MKEVHTGNILNLSRELVHNHDISDKSCNNHDGATPTPTATPAPTTGTLTITKKCLPMFPSGGNLCPGTSFSIQVTGNNPQPSLISLTDGGSQIVTLGPGSFAITETPRVAFLFFNGPDCSVLIEGVEATGTISAGQNLSCTITNFL